jgi:hypothetical protein
MKATFRLTEPKKVEATLSITMPLEDWEALRAQLPVAWPSWKLSSVIDHLVTKAQVEFGSAGEI